MHREIMGVTDPKKQVDHINHNGLDNRKENLRVCSQRQNSHNSMKRINSETKYKGINRIKKDRPNCWQSRIMVYGKPLHIGVYPTQELAALAYNEAAKKYFGEFASLNNVNI